ncbi:RUN domain-containing protein 1-like isoform X2 [Mytilus trossulus]|uniref:RUN domain-containing protein 1-like isoform X1 n=2 Tax=Mytilus trossulus TaxID=6551 RepID=UPI00300520F1
MTKSRMMEETQVSVNDESYDYDSFDENSDERPTERWAPLGAAAVSPAPSQTETSHHAQNDQLRQLEEEQEQLNSSLLALTTHFAHVQFRLKQIVSAPPDDKETLLQELEEFAFRGIPDARLCLDKKLEEVQEEMSDQEHEQKLIEQREKQRELIEQLKKQLEELETYAYETGDADVVPTSKVMEKQKVVIDELKHKLDLNLEGFDSLSTDQLKQIVDHAVGEIVNPGKVKEKLIQQLSTQITDLERFIQFLQGEATSPGPLGKERCTCTVHKFPSGDCSDTSSKDCKVRDRNTNKHNKKNVKETRAFIKKSIELLQMFLISQFGCGGRDFQRNLLKKTTKGNHWGDLRARLEVAINKVLEAAVEEEKSQEKDARFSEYGSDSEESQEQSSALLTQTVRRDLSMAIRDLIEHGLMEIGQSTSVVPWGCFPSRSGQVTRQMHAWDLLIKFYEMKHGKEYNESPARMLSQSFHLDIVGGKAITAKQTLLGAIDTVISSHTPLKRTEDSHFKAIISLALNERKLPTWLKLLFRTQSLIDNYYQDWSYVARTGFDDAIKALDSLNKINFRLPVDLAVRPFSNIKDAF